MNNVKSKDTQMNVLSVVTKTLAATFHRMWFVFLLLFIGAIAVALLELVPPLLLKRIIDSYLNVGLLDGLWLMATLYVLASVGSSIVGFGLVFVSSYIGQNLILELRFAMADHLRKLPMSYYNRTPLGDTMSRLTSDAETVNSIFSQGGGGGGGGGLSNLPVDLVKSIAILIAMFTLSPGLTLIVLAVVPIVYLVSSYFRRNTYRLQLQIRKTVGAINAFLQETFSGIRIVKAYGKEDQYDGYFQKPLGNNLNAANSAAVYDAYFPVVMQIIRVIVIAAVVWFGAKTGVDARLAITIGGLAAMADLVGRLFTPIEALAQDFQTLQQALAGLKRISELLVEKPEEKGATQHIASVSAAGRNQNAAEIRDISFSYQPGKPVLKNVSLAVPQGRKIAIVGRTGSGKTTLMNLIAGLYTSDTGTISVLGYNPYQVDPHDRRKLLGVVPQNVHIFEGTIKENITLRDGQIPLEAIEKAAQIVGLHDYITGLEKGYDTLLGVGGIKLSFGQGQLLSMARAIISDPALLLLDEPTSGMDAITEAAIFSAFRNISKDRSLITISHRLSGIVDADEVHIMASGRIVQSGTPEKLAGESGWYSVFRQLEDLGWKMD